MLCVAIAAASAVTLLFSAPRSTASQTTVDVTIVAEYQSDDPVEDTFPAGGEVYIRIDGEYVGNTDELGQRRAQLEAGEYVIEGIVPSFAYGRASIDLQGNTGAEVRLLLDDTSEHTEHADLNIPEIANDIWSNDEHSFSIEFAKGDQPVIIEVIEEVSLLEIDFLDPDNRISDLTDAFEVDDSGKLVVADIDTLKKAFGTAPFDQGRLKIAIIDVEGFTYVEYKPFWYGRHALAGQLVAPTSHPDISLASREVTLSRVSEPLTLSVTTEQDGSFRLPQRIPSGSYRVFSGFGEGESYFDASAVLRVDEDHTVRLTMAARESGTQVLIETKKSTQADGPDLLDIEDVSFGGVKTKEIAFSVPKGTLAIDVNTQLWGDLCSAKKDDAGECIVLLPIRSAVDYFGYVDFEILTEDGEVLLKQVHTIDENHCFGHFGLKNCLPMLRCAGDFSGPCVLSRNDGPEVVDLGDRAVEADLSLIARYTFSHESESPYDIACCECGVAVCEGPVASVFYAFVGVAPAIQVTDINFVRVQPRGRGIEPALGDQNTLSIPVENARNHHRVYRDLVLRFDPGTVVESVRVAINIDGEEVEILDERVGDPLGRVRMIRDNTLRVLTSFTDIASTIDTSPPPAHNPSHEFLVRGRSPEGKALEASATSPFRALWRMPEQYWPDRFRYSRREAGGDDWAAKGTFEWMVANQRIMNRTRINDISGEHALDLDHDSHFLGTDLDVFHFYTFPNGARSGGTNYLRLAENVLQTINGDQPSRQRVRNWVLESRDALEQLITMPSVDRLWYAVGSCYPREAQRPHCRNERLSRGWARSLLQNGTAQDVDGNPLNVNVPLWRPEGENRPVACARGSRIQCNSTHDSHVHIDLSEAAIRAPLRDTPYDWTMSGFSEIETERSKPFFGGNRR